MIIRELFRIYLKHVHSGVGIEEKSIFETYIAMLRKFRNLGLKFWKNRLAQNQTFLSNCIEPIL